MLVVVVKMLDHKLSVAPMAGWEVSYIDTFSGDGVNWQNWTAQIDANFNNEVQCYTDDDSSINKNLMSLMAP